MWKGDERVGKRDGMVEWVQKTLRPLVGSKEIAVILPKRERDPDKDGGRIEGGGKHCQSGKVKGRGGTEGTSLEEQGNAGAVPIKRTYRACCITGEKIRTISREKMPMGSLSR